MKKRLQILLGILALLISIFTIVASAQRSAKTEQRLKLRDTLAKPGGVHQAALDNGGKLRFSDVYVYGIAPHLTLESLAKNSDIALVGTPVSNECKVINDGRTIVTQYQVKVEEPIQGKVHWGDIITVDLLGGSVAFSDGATAELEITNLPRLQLGRSYVLYLAVPETFKDYQPAGGPEGIFELQADGKVLPFATPEYTSAARKGDDAAEFLDRVRVAARFGRSEFVICFLTTRL